MKNIYLRDEADIQAELGEKTYRLQRLDAIDQMQQPLEFNWLVPECQEALIDQDIPQALADYLTVLNQLREQFLATNDMHYYRLLYNLVPTTIGVDFP